MIFSKTAKGWVASFLVLAAVGFTNPASANPQQVRDSLTPVPVPVTVTQSLRFAQLTNQLVEECKQTDRVDRRMIDGLERQVPALVQRILRSDEPGAFDVVIDGMKRLTLIIYACGA